MRMALLIGARPKQLKSGPVVRLSGGSWRIKFEGLQATVCRVSINSSTALLEITDDLIIDGPCFIQVIVLVGGDESSFNAYAEKVNGPVP